jgi:GDPmannose 4,6-dehydratase
MTKKIALITGITGQDGTYLTKLLLSKGYEVHGMHRRTSRINNVRIDTIYREAIVAKSNLFTHFGDLSDAGMLIKLMQQIQPDEVYHLAAMSHVQVSFDQPEYTADINATGTLRLLEAIKINGLCQKTKFYQASTSELFGNADTSPQGETTPFHPTSPYAISKLFAFWMTTNYRNSYGLFACNGILFNHESPLRDESFVTRKITMAVAKIGLGCQKILYLGNLNAKRDWGHAEDYVEAMWLMLQKNKPDDYVIATGISTSVREFVEKSFDIIGVKLQFEGNGTNEKGYCLSSQNNLYPVKKNSLLVAIDPQFYRPTDIEWLIGDTTKAKKDLHWEARTSIDCLVHEMVTSDIKSVLNQTNTVK